jgi:hypothetical protein
MARGTGRRLCEEGIIVTRTVLRSVVVTSAVAVLMAGCGTPEAGSAATIGSRRISVHDVQSATADIQTLYGPDQPVPQRSVLYLLAAAPFIQSIASRSNAGTSVDDARQTFASKVSNPSPAALTVIQANTSLGKLDQLGGTQTTQLLREVTQDLSHAGFTVNPRYGTFDPTRGTLMQSQPNWLPTPSPTSTPTQ